MSRPVLLERPKTYWQCPSCDFQHVSTETQPHSQMHNCPTHRGMTVPLDRVYPGQLNRPKTRHVVMERQDYVGAERGLRFDAEGRPAMAVRTERPDGSNDCMVFPAVATATINRKEQA